MCLGAICSTRKGPIYCIVCVCSCESSASRKTNSAHNTYGAVQEKIGLLHFFNLTVFGYRIALNFN